MFLYFIGIVDYLPVTMIVALSPGEGNFPECIHIPLVDDEIALEPNKEFRVILSLVNSAPGAVVLSPPSTVVTIVDNDGKHYIVHTLTMTYIQCACIHPIHCTTLAVGLRSYTIHCVHACSAEHCIWCKHTASV